MSVCLLYLRAISMHLGPWKKSMGVEKFKRREQVQ
jgi:hypothetical protein